jgi:hypothetical protein
VSCRSPRPTLEAIVTQAIALIAASAGSDLASLRDEAGAINQMHRTAWQPGHLSFFHTRFFLSHAREVAAQRDETLLRLLELRTKYEKPSVTSLRTARAS